VDPNAALNQIFGDVMTQLTGIFTDITVAIAGLVSISLLIFGLSQIMKLFNRSIEPEANDEESDSKEKLSVTRGNNNVF
jgi:hypothetical protein